MNKYLAEFCGTFFWMLTIGCVSIGAGAGSIPAIGIGIVVAVAVVLLTGVSGAHFNPAVTVALWRSGNLSVKELAPYIIFQFLGAGAGSAAVKVIKGGMGVGALQNRITPILLTEFMFTLLLCYAMIYLQHQRERTMALGNGLVIGGIVMGGVFTAGSVSGAAFNPATTVGSSVLGLLSFKNLWIYLLAQVIAGFLAPYAYRGLNPEKR